jgi:hypothetical protein
MKNILRQATLFWICYYFFTVCFETNWLRWPFPAWAWHKRLMTAMITESGLLLIKIPATYLVFLIIEKFQFRKKANLMLIIGIVAVILLAILAYRPLVYYFYNPYLYKNAPNQLLYDFDRCVTAFADLVFAVGIAFAVKQYLLQIL